MTIIGSFLLIDLYRELKATMGNVGLGSAKTLSSMGLSMIEKLDIG